MVVSLQPRSPEEWSSLVALARARTRERPDDWLYMFLADGEHQADRLTHVELDRRARGIAAQLQSRGLVGDRALLLFPPGLDFIAAFFGCLYAGTVAVPAYPPRGRRNQPALKSIALDARVRTVLTTGALRPRVRSWLVQVGELEDLEVLVTDRPDGSSEDAWQEPDIGPETLAFLQYTSGSTANPKGVRVSHGNLLHNERLIRRAFRQEGGRTVVGWLPLYHDMGLIGNVLQPLYSGGRAVLMSPMAFLQRPVRWLQAISRHRGHTSGGPDFAYGLCVEKVREDERAELDLSSWEVAFNGAEPVRHATLERFAEVFGDCGFRRRAFVPCYGLAEATLFVSGGSHGDAPAVLHVSAAALEEGRIEDAAEDAENRPLVSSGRVAEGLTVRIVDPETRQPSPPGRIGEIWEAGPSVAGGYWGRPEATVETFGARLASGDGPYLRTGDLGWLDGDGLFVTGRLKDLVILRGRNYYPQDIELTVEACHPDLLPRGGAAFAVEAGGAEQLVVVHEIRRRPAAQAEEVVEAVRRAVSEEHDVHLHEVVLIRAGTLPRTTSGKVRRRSTADAYRAGELAAVCSAVTESGASGPAPEEEGIETRTTSREDLLGLDPVERQDRLIADLRSRAARVARADPARIGAEQPLTTLGFDSLMAAELRNQLEEELGVAPSWEDLMSEATLAEIAEDLLVRLKEGKPSSTPFPPDAVPTAGEHPLSYGQRALWYLHRLVPESAAYNLAFAARLSSPFDAPALRRATGRWVERHPALGATFPFRDGQPRQRFDSVSGLDFQDVDAAGWSRPALDERMGEEAHRPFDLTTGPLVRVHLFRRSDDAFLLLVAHHIVLDLQSFFLLVAELREHYSAELNDLPPLPPPCSAGYADYVCWQQAMVESEEGKRRESYWLERLAGFRQLDLPADRPRRPALSDRGASVSCLLPETLTRDVEELARTAGATPYAVLLGAFQALLQRYSGQDDLVVGTPFAARGRADLAATVGYFTNALPVRGDLAGDPTFEVLLERLGAGVRGALEHQDYPAPLLVEKLRVERDPSRNPLFEVLFAFEKVQRLDDPAFAALLLGQPGTRLCLGDLELESVALESRAVQFDLVVRWVANGPDVIGQWIFRSDLFDAATVERMAAHYRRILAVVTSHPRKRLSDVALLSPAERQQVVAEWNDSGAAWDDETPRLHRLAEIQAARVPDAAAIESEGRWLTYRELEARSNQLARRLRRGAVGTETPVGIYMERSAEMVVALLGVLKAGGSYVPLDPAYPAERLAFMTRDAGVRLLLTGGAEPVPDFQGETVPLEKSWRSLDSESWRPPRIPVDGRALAYVIYTSGTTGRPKGVMVSHGAAVNFLRSMARRPGLAEDEALLAVTTLSFDIALLELLLPLATGARLEVMSREVAADGHRLAARVRRAARPVLQATPATWRLLLEAGFEPGKGLKVLCGGEALPRDLADRLGSEAPVWNVYGPTETTVWSAAEPVGPEDGPVAIGRPIANTGIHLVTSRLAPAAIGVPGELAIGGSGLARGYLDRPALTAEKFIPDPLSERPGCRLYKTGDLARFRPDGRVVCLGRLDHQVKLRGYRIEPGEIEALLRQQPELLDAVVGLREDAPGRRLLQAYVVPAAGPIDAEELRRHLKARLPSYMVPASFVVVEALPKTSSGKVDRAALARIKLDPEDRATKGGPPETPDEKKLAAIWTRVLKIDEVGLDDNFFELGGDSILSVQVITRSAEAGLRLTPRLFLEHQTLAELAAAATPVEPEAVDDEPAGDDFADLSDLDLDQGQLDRIFQKFSR